jgi:hypothetical protein
MATTSVEKIIALGPEPMAAPPTATGLRQKDDGGFFVRWLRLLVRTLPISR